MKLLKHGRAALLLAALAGLQACELGSAPGGGTGAEGLTGIVVDGGGAPVAGARVRVYPASGALAKGALSLVARADSTWTGIDGRYAFKNLPPGIYDLETSIRLGDTSYGLILSGIVFDKRLDLGVDTVRAGGGAAPPARAFPNFPEDNAVEVPRSPRLNWAVAYSPEGVLGYHVQLSFDSLFSPLLVDSVVTEAEYFASSPYPGLAVQLLEPGGLYYWRITTLGRFGTRTVSTVSRFRVMTGLTTN